MVGVCSDPVRRGPLLDGGGSPSGRSLIVYPSVSTVSAKSDLARIREWASHSLESGCSTKVPGNHVIAVLGGCSPEITGSLDWGNLSQISPLKPACLAYGSRSRGKTTEASYRGKIEGGATRARGGGVWHVDSVTVGIQGCPASGQNSGWSCVRCPSLDQEP